MVSTVAAATRVGPGYSSVGDEDAPGGWGGRGRGASLGKPRRREGEDRGWPGCGPAWLAPRPCGQRACAEDPASRPVTRSARYGRERPRAVRVAGRLPPASSGLAGDSRPRCRTRSSPCIGHSGRGPGKGLLVSCGCCDPLERTHGDRLKSEMCVLFAEL